MRELSLPVAFSRELSFPGAKLPGNFRSRERKFSVGTFAPRSENTEERKVLIPFSARTFQTQDTSDLRQFGTISLVPKCLTFLCRCRSVFGTFGGVFMFLYRFTTSLHMFTSIPSIAIFRPLDPLTRCPLFVLRFSACAY